MSRTTVPLAGRLLGEQLVPDTAGHICTTGHAGWLSCATTNPHATYPAWPGEELQGPSVLLWYTAGGMGFSKYAHVALFTQHLVIFDS